MPKLTLMIFATQSCAKSSKVSFQKLDTDLEDLEAGLGKINELVESGKLNPGQKFPLYGYVHASADTEDDSDWDIQVLD